MSLAEDGVSGALSVTALVWPAVTAVLAVIVLVAVFLLWRKWRQLRSRFQRPDLY
jgi:ABC-type nickel/cobalt efflux system permease component RcnA